MSGPCQWRDLSNCGSGRLCVVNNCGVLSAIYVHLISMSFSFNLCKYFIECLFLFVNLINCSISEIPDVQLNLSRRPDVIKQAFIAGRSEMYSTNTPVMAISLLLCISRCQEAHGNLLKLSVVDEILDLCTKPGIISSPAEIKSLK